MSSDPTVPALAVAAPGLAPLTAQELRALGIAPAEVQVEGVRFQASLTDIYRANLWLRTASRVIVRAAAFHADSFSELERRARRVDWSRFVTPERPVRIRVTCRKSRLYHSDAVAQRIALAVVRAGGVMVPPGAPDAAADGDALSAGNVRSAPAAEPLSEQLVIVRLFRDHCSISLDSSGALLHRRGYRQETAKAPMRETLAAALLMASGWDTRGPLLDPFCGAGTLAIEGAWLARARAPGRDRGFAFMGWPSFDRGRWDALLSEAQAGERPGALGVIQASDRDAGAVRATLHNAERAGVTGDIDAGVRTLSAVTPPAGPGWLVTNPPYGVRIGERRALRDLYAQLGHVARARCAGWTVAILAADRGLVRETGLAFASALRTVNGGIPVEMVTAPVPPSPRSPPA